MRMTRLFRSKSCTLPRITTPDYSSNPTGLSWEPRKSNPSQYDSQEEEEEQEEEEDDEDSMEDEDTEYSSLRRRKEDNSNIRRSNDSSPVLMMGSFNFIGGVVEKGRNRRRKNMVAINNPAAAHQYHHPLVAIVLAALRKSLLVTCSVERDDVSSNHLDIGWPTDVRHVSHVTFDPFNGFLGLPLDLQYDLPYKVPSASVSVFGVSAQSMQCSYDHRGNCVPTILLMMQNRLYSDGGLLAEGIFRINADNSQEENVRNQLNRGVIPHGIDIHCLAGLIKAWFRELPTGVLDSLTPEQVMHCNTEEECTRLVNLLPSTEAALLDWAINLMADVVLHEHYNKMNARNIAMVFAPNMTQMADPLTALIHAVQVMNLLKTLINKSLREREELGDSRNGLVSSKEDVDETDKVPSDGSLETDTDRRKKVTETECFPEKREAIIVCSKRQSLESRYRDGFEEEGILEKLSLRKLCRHPVFQLSKAGVNNKKKAVAAERNSRPGSVGGS